MAALPTAAEGAEGALGTWHPEDAEGSGPMSAPGISTSLALPSLLSSDSSSYSSGFSGFADSCKSGLVLCIYIYIWGMVKGSDKKKTQVLIVDHGAVLMVCWNEWGTLKESNNPY